MRGKHLRNSLLIIVVTDRNSQVLRCNLIKFSTWVYRYSLLLTINDSDNTRNTLSLVSRTMLKFFILLVALPAIFARTPVRSCGAGIPLPTAVFFGTREAPCLVEPCNISRSGLVGVTYVDFVTIAASVAIRPQVRASLFGGSVTITQEMPEEILRNPCGILTQGSCPFAAGQVAAYRLELPVDPTTPLLSTDTEITLFGDGNDIIFCYRLTTQLVV